MASRGLAVLAQPGKAFNPLVDEKSPVG
jgi:hypothetical protein